MAPPRRLVARHPRHRDRACEETGTEPRYREFTGPSPAQFVLGQIIHRSLDPGQRAVIAQEFEPALAEEAKARQGTRTDRQPVRPRAQKSAPKRATAEAASLTGASAREVQRAKRVAKHAPELLPEVKAGRTTLRSAGARILAAQTRWRGAGGRSRRIRPDARPGRLDAQIAHNRPAGSSIDAIT
jgi:hypothetical protein